ncbi:MAG: VWA domain-containing protein [Asticcacaulis sp.]
MRFWLYCGAAASVFMSTVSAAAPVVAATKDIGKPSPVHCGSADRGDNLKTPSLTDKRRSVAPKLQTQTPAPVVGAAPPPPVVSVQATKKEERVEYRGPAQIVPPPPAPPPPPPPPPAPPVPLTAGVLARDAMISSDIAAPNRERYAGEAVSSVMRVAEAPVSTFSVDVDTGAYSNVRRMLNAGQRPPAAAVRSEEMINYFRYDYAAPKDRSQPFSVTADVAQTPWNPQTRLLRVGLRAYDLSAGKRPASNLVFLVDVSGSMNSQDKLPLVKTALSGLADRLQPNDKVSIVVYAGAAGVVLEPTSDGRYVKQALECLSAGGSTAGGRGIALAYAVARANFVKGGVNRVLLATDGDFNVGISRDEDILALVKQNRDDGITLTALGFGTGNLNDSMMEKIADAGNGNYAYIDNAMEARKVLDDELSATLVTVAKDVKIQIEFNPAQVAQYRLIGYENRALAEEDFNNDKVDAGDIGAGHQVTAIYEIVPAGTDGWLPDRRYEGNQPAPVAKGGELAFLKLRYKLPGEDTSRLIEQALPARALKAAAAPSGDFAFATAVAAYGQILREDKYLNGFDMESVRRLAGHQSDYRRQEFIELTKLAAEARVTP